MPADSGILRKPGKLRLTFDVPKERRKDTTELTITAEPSIGGSLLRALPYLIPVHRQNLIPGFMDVIGTAIGGMARVSWMATQDGHRLWGQKEGAVVVFNTENGALAFQLAVKQERIAIVEPLSYSQAA